MTLYDAYGRPVDRCALKDEQAGPTIAGVRNIYNVTHPSAGLTPEKLFAILTQAEFGDPFYYLELAEEMEEKDMHYLGVLGTRKETAAQLAVIVRPASQSAPDVKAADLVGAQLRHLLTAEALFDILDAVGKGYSATEIAWDTQGSEWRPARLMWRDPRWFLWDWVSGEQLLVRTIDGGDTVYARERPAHSGTRFANSPWNGLQPMTARLDPFKFIVHVSKAKSGLPIRGGIARAAAWAWLFKNFLMKDWLGFAETFGQPFRLGKYAPGATADDRAALLSAVTNIGSDAAAVIPDSMMIEFQEARAARSGETVYSEFCGYLDAQISKAVLGQTLTTELPKSGGSRAAATVHEAVRRDILASDAKRLAATLTRDVVKPIVDLNLGVPASGEYPLVALGLPDDIDDKVFADIVASMADRGLQISQRTVLDRLGMPAATPGEPVLHPAQKGTP